jgi:hypothetical protein
LSAEAYARRLDKIGDMLATRPARMREMVGDFDLVRRACFAITRAAQPTASPQERAQGEHLAGLVGVDFPPRSTGWIDA